MEEWLAVDIYDVNNNRVVKINFFTEIELETGWCFSVPLVLVTELGEAVNGLLIGISSGSFENMVKACSR